MNIHVKYFHLGVSHILSIIRREYWIENGRQAVMKVLNECVNCRRVDGGPFIIPDLPPFPTERVSKVIPFTYVGVDYFGPLYAKCCGNVKKFFVVIFTCLTVRAIHLELVESMKATDFLIVFRRFIAERNMPKKIISDNAAQFKKFKSFIDHVWRENLRKNNEFVSFLLENNIEWNFIPENAPWMGGVYERLILSVKKCIKKSVSGMVNFENLRTTLKEIENVLNSRPLTYISGDLEDVITPAHFIYNRSHISVGNELGVINTRSELANLWNSSKRILESFWSIWYKDYLSNLRKKDNSIQRNAVCRVPSVGEPVLIEEDVLRGKWRLGVVDQLHISSDGNIRSANIKVKTGILTRPIKKLYPLELNFN
ncbi:uncharacterized protein LOC135834011 [Planococcus citri]|uniref:uncharacterized protein LOC135834011 n=1 Tax=Planococcus citri TaxID=170843 RepID=UPI0031F86178